MPRGAAAEPAADIIPEMEFRDEPVATILLVLAHAAGRSVLPDATVTGRASYYFRERSFDAALTAFATAQELFVEERDGTLHVSRLHIESHPNGTLSVRARDVPLGTLLDRIDRATAVPVTHAGVAGRHGSVHAEKLPVGAILEAVAAPHADLAVRTLGPGFVVALEDPRRVNTSTVRISAGSTGLTVVIRDADLAQVLDALSDETGMEYLSLLRRSPSIGDLALSDVDLPSVVRALALAAEATAVQREGRWLFLPGRTATPQDFLAATLRVHLEHAPVRRVLEQLPRQLSATATLAAVPGENAVAVTGLPDEMEPILAYLRTMDRQPQGVAYHRFDLAYADPQEVLAALPAGIAREHAVVLDEANALMLQVTPSQRERAARFIADVDVRPRAVPVRLQHTDATVIIDTLPDTIPHRYVHRTGDAKLLLFTGPAEVEARLRELLAVVDSAPPQIRYDLFIVQYQEGESVDYRLSIESVEVRPFDTTILLGRLGELLSLSADIISLFGHRFAVSLSSALSNNEAQVLADTSVTAVSGTPVSFRNTETYRYRDVPPVTGEEEGPIGVTREITSGLFIDIDGNVVGSDEVALSISATVSKRGRDVGDRSGNPPPTAERVVTSTLRAQSGRPIVVGSFLLRDRTRNVRRIPVLGHIPLLGWLFRGVQSSSEESELVVYLVPHVVAASAPSSTEEQIRAIYARFRTAQEGPP
ncbi:MAG: type II secretion system protein GspD [bacterium]